ncbi:hypothetical protein E8E15_000964 [Penicillium rubens]|nr:hypothetical protein E8E15_000964 [Penicillium rubens]KAJ5033217.1 hypothetical protein NUH16_003133 [Penicillium rubens]
MSSRIIDAIKTDHCELEDYYKKILNSTSDKEKAQWQSQFTWELARHSIGEELVVYPQFEKKPLMDALWRRRTVKEQLKKFQNMKPSDPQFQPTITAVMQDLSEHIKEEESQGLPKLEGALAPEESENLSRDPLAGLRCHLSAPDKPPFETAIGLMTAPIDHLADLFRKWPHTSGMPNPSTK